MLCPSVFQHPTSPFMDLHWPVRSLWPETRPLVYHMEQEMMRHMQEMRHNMEYMERLHQKIFEEIDQSVSSSSSVFQPISFQMGKDSDLFALTLDTKDFSPEDLSVKQVGRKLRVSGKTEKKQDDGKGSYSYRCQEFRQEFDLPDGVNAEQVTCSLTNGQLRIHAPQQAVTNGKERVVPISLAPAIAPAPSPQSSGAEGHIPIPVENETKKD
ncbi:heat shock protein beta-11-like [Osmerus eperlanus]|uniref:heat shock protein beta-11-like n=1 Tax=Osmerus eperlanus TaxID=29151 RepID=UPI002E0DDE2D